MANNLNNPKEPTKDEILAIAEKNRKVVEDKSLVAVKKAIEEDPYQAGLYVNILKNQSTGYTEGEQDKLDAYHQGVSLYNNYLKNKAKADGERLQEIEQKPEKWYEPFKELVQEGDILDWLWGYNWMNATAKSALRLAGWKDTVGYDALEALQTIGDFGPTFNTMVLGTAGRFVDVPDWRPSAFVPDPHSLEAGARDLTATGSKLLGKIGIDLHPSHILQHPLGRTSESDQKGELNETYWEEYNRETERIRKGAAEFREKHLEGVDKPFVWLDENTMAGDKSTSNWLSEWASRSKEMRDARNKLETEFTVDNETPFWSPEGMKWLTNGMPDIVASLEESLFIGGMLSKMKLLGSIGKATKGIKTYKEINTAKKVINSVAKGHLAKVLGISGVLTSMESGHIEQDVEKQALLISAEKYGGEDWEKYLDENVRKPIHEQGIAKGWNERQISTKIEHATLDAIRPFFSAKSPEQYRKIAEGSAEAARMAFRQNNAMIITNMVDAAMILKGVRYAGKIGRVMNRIGGVKPVSTKPLSDAAIKTRSIKVKQPRVWTGTKNVGEVAGAGISEGVFEESGINKYAEWRGLALATGEGFYGNNYIDRVFAGETLEDMIFGGIGGMMMSGATSVSSFRSKVKAYDEYKLRIEKLKEHLPSLAVEDLRKAVILSNSITENQELRGKIEAAEARGESVEELEKAYLHNQALRAFQTQTTDDLIKIYQGIAKNNPNEETRNHAQQAVQEILELEQLYNDAQQFKDVNNIYHAGANMRITGNSLNQINENISLLRQPAVESLERMKEGLDADYTITENGIQFKGNQAEQLKEKAMKDNNVQNYIGATNNKINLEAIFKQQQKDLDYLMSEENNEQVDRIQRASKRVKMKMEHLLSSETKGEFNERLREVLEPYNIENKRRREYVKELNDFYDQLSVLGQTGVTEAKSRTVNKDRLREKNLRRITKRFNKSRQETQEDEDLQPASLEDFQEEDRRVIWNTVNNIVKDNPGISFSDMIESLLGVNDFTLTDKQREDRKTIVEEQFNVYAAGWKMNGFASTDFGTVYQKYFGKAKDETIEKLSSIKPTKKTTQAEIETKAETAEDIEEKQKIRTQEEETKPKRTPLEKLKAKIEVNVIVFKSMGQEIVDRAGNITRKNRVISNSNVKGERLYNPNKFNPGESVGLATDTRPNTRFSIYKKTKKGYVDYGTTMEDFHKTKFGTTKSTTSQYPTVDNNNGVFTFTEIDRDKKVKYRRYNQRPVKKIGDGKEIGLQYMITDDFLVTAEEDYAVLSGAAEVLLHRVNNVPSSQGKSTISVTIIGHDGKSQPRTIEIENEIEQNQPIMITDTTDNEGIGWIQTPSSLLGKQSGSSLRTAQKKLADYRKSIINGNRKHATISKNFGNGYEIMTDDKNNPVVTSIKEQDPNAEIGQIRNSKLFLGGEEFETKKRKLVNPKMVEDGNDGMIFELRKVGGDTIDGKSVEMWQAFPVANMNEELDEQSANNIEWVLKAFLTQNDVTEELEHQITENKRDGIRNAVMSLDEGFDIFTFQGLKDYLSRFTMMEFPDELKITKFTEKGEFKEVTRDTFRAFVNSDSVAVGQPVFYVQGNQVFFGIKGENLSAGDPMVNDGIIGAVISPNSGNIETDKVEFLINKMIARKTKFKRQHSDKAYGNDATILNFDNEGNTTDVQYKDHQKTNYKTKVKAHHFESGGESFKTTNINATIELDSDVKSTVVAEAPLPAQEEKISIKPENLSEEISERKTSEEVKENNPEPDVEKVLKEARRMMQMLGSNKFDSVVEKSDDEGMNMLISEEQRENIRKKIESIPGVSPIQKLQLIDAVFNMVVEKHENITAEQINDELKNSYERLLGKTRQEFQRVIDHLKQLESKKYDIPAVIAELESGMKMFDIMQEHWTEIESRAKEKLLKYTSISEKQLAEEALNETEGADRIYSKSDVEYKGKQSLPTELKKFMAGIYNLKKVGDNHEVVRGFLGVNTYVPFDDFMNIVTTIIGSNPKANMSFEEVIETLRSRVDSLPALEDLIIKLQNAPEQLKHKFMTHMVKHNMSMKVMQYKFNPRTQKHDLRIFDTNSSDIQSVIYNEWRGSLDISRLINRDEEGNLIIDKKKARELYDKYMKFKDTPKTQLTVEELVNWLEEFGIEVSRQTMLAVMNDELISAKGKRISFASNNMWKASETTSGLFGGLAYKLQQYINSPDDVNITESDEAHPFRTADNAIKSLARIETKFTTRAVTVAFMDGDKVISGFINPKFATDRIDELKVDSDVRKALHQDPFSSNSMLLKLLDESTEVENLLYADHIGINSMKKKGSTPSGDENAITKLSEGDQEVVRQGFFGDTRQGTVTVKHNGIPLRMGRMMFPTMSDKEQMLTMYMPVMNLTDEHIGYKDGKLQMKKGVADTLIGQLLIPELRRIISFHNGNTTNTVGLDLASQVFLMIPQFNNLRIPVKLQNGKVVERRLIHLIAENPSKYNEKFIMENYRDDILNTLRGVIQAEVSKKVVKWGDEGILDDKKKPEKLNSEYFKISKSKRRFAENETEMAATDYVINNLISMSNIFQTISGDIAFYSDDKYFENFGISEEIRKRQGLKSFGYADAVAEMNKQIEENEGISALRNRPRNWQEPSFWEDKETMRPLPYIADSDQDYINLTQNIGTNLGKRLALLLAPGTKVHGIESFQYRQVFLEDSNTYMLEMASNMSFMVELHYGEQKRIEFEQYLDTKPSEARLKEHIDNNFPTLKEFFSIEATDAQEFTTSKEHIDVLYGQGRLSREQYDTINKKLGQGEDLTFDELKIVFQPMKPVYTGSIIDNSTGNQPRMRMMYVKSSSYPLLPQVTRTTALENLRVAMEDFQKQGMNVRAAYKSAVKVGATVTGIKAFTGKSINPQDMETSSVVLDRRNFKIQQDVPVKAFEKTEDEISIGTQLMKLLFGDGVTELGGFKLDDETLSGKQLLEKYNNTYGELVQHIKDGLYQELGIAEDGTPFNEKKFLDNLSKLLKKEAKERNYPQQDIDGLQIIPKYKNNAIVGFSFRNSMWLSTNAVRYEALLNSIITKRMIKLKLPGYSYVAGSQRGYEIVTSPEEVENSQSIIYTKYWNGKELIASTENNKAQIMMPSRFRDTRGNLIDLFQTEKGYYDDLLEREIISLENYQRLTKDLDPNQKMYIEKVQGRWQLREGKIADELLSMTSFRIPTSAHVSASQIEIVGFLPPENGDLMVLPKEFAVQKGLDYDIDKEFSYHLWHTFDNKGNIVSIDTRLDERNIDDNINTLTIELNKLNRTEDLSALEEAIEMEEDDESNARIMYEILNSVMLDFSAKNPKDIIRKLNKLKTLKKKLLQNRIVKIHSAVIGSKNSEIQKKINKALSMKFAREQSDLLGTEQEGFTTLLSDEYQAMKMRLGAAGQMGIGVYSNYVVVNSLMQQAENQVSILNAEGEIQSLTIGNYTANLSFGRYTNIFTTKDRNLLLKAINEKDYDLRKKGRLAQKLQSGKLTLSEIEDLVKGTKYESVLYTTLEDGTKVSKIRPISEAFAERQNTATDNEKEQIMGNVGVNSNTINVDSLLTLLGFDKGDIIKDEHGNQKETSIAYLLISQPIIKEYVKRKNKRNSNINDGYITDADILSEMLKEIAPDENGIGKRKDLTSQNLYDAIKGKLPKSSHHKIQAATLLLFSQLEGHSRELNKVQQLLGITKDGLDKSLFNTIYLHDNIQEISLNQTFSNVTDLIGEFENEAGEGFIQVGSVFVKPKTMMGHLLIQGVSTGYNLWQPLFPYVNTSLKETMNRIIDISKLDNPGKKKEIDTKNLIVKELRKFINTIPGVGTINGHPETERRRLFMDEKGKPSLAAYLKKLKNQKHPAIIGNDFLSKMLEFEIGSEGGISKVKFDNTSAQAFDEEHIYASIMDLIIHPKPLPPFTFLDHAEQEYTTAHLAEDLIAYSFLSGGIQGAINFAKFIPLDYLEEVGYTQRMNNIDIHDGGEFHKMFTNNGEINNFIVQFFQHNPKLLKNYKPEELGYNKNVNVDALDSFSQSKIEIPIDETHPEMVSIYNKKKGNYNVYLLNDGHYIRIPHAGSHGMSEYDINSFNVNGLTNPYKQEQLYGNTETKPDIQDNYGIYSGDAVGILRNISTRNDSLGNLAMELLKTNNGGVTVEITDLTSRGTYYESSHRIEISERIINAGDAENQAVTFLHEYIHSITARELSQYFDNNGDSRIPIAKMPQHIQDLNTVFQQSKKELNVSKTEIDAVREKATKEKKLDTKREKLVYSFINLKEFVSKSMTDTDFQNELNNVTYENESLFKRFTDAIVSLIKSLNPNIEGNLLGAVHGAIFNTIEAEQTPKTPEKAKSEAIKLLNERVDKPIKDTIINSYELEGNNRYIEFVKPSNPAIVYRVQNDNGKYTLWEKEISEPEFTKQHQKEADALLKKHGTLAKFMINKFGSNVHEAFTAKMKSVKKKESPVIRRKLKSKISFPELLSREYDVEQMLNIIDTFDTVKFTKKQESLYDDMYDILYELDEVFEANEENFGERFLKLLENKGVIDFVDKNQMEIDFEDYKKSESIAVTVQLPKNRFTENTRKNAQNLKPGDVLIPRIQTPDTPYLQEKYEYLLNFVDKEGKEYGAPKYGSPIDKKIVALGNKARIRVLEVHGDTFKFEVFEHEKDSKDTDNNLLPEVNLRGIEQKGDIELAMLYNEIGNEIDNTFANVNANKLNCK